jgi:hypothetical protein
MLLQQKRLRRHKNTNTSYDSLELIYIVNKFSRTFNVWVFLKRIDNLTLCKQNLGIVLRINVKKIAKKE